VEEAGLPIPYGNRSREFLRPEGLWRMVFTTGMISWVRLRRSSASLEHSDRGYLVEQAPARPWMHREYDRVHV
jgi:hypothetical protein